MQTLYYTVAADFVGQLVGFASSPLLRSYQKQFFFDDLPQISPPQLLSSPSSQILSIYRRNFIKLNNYIGSFKCFIMFKCDTGKGYLSSDSSGTNLIRESLIKELCNFA